LNQPALFILFSPFPWLSFPHLSRCPLDSQIFFFLFLFSPCFFVFPRYLSSHFAPDAPIVYLVVLTEVLVMETVLLSTLFSHCLPNLFSSFPAYTFSSGLLVFPPGRFSLCRFFYFFFFAVQLARPPRTGRLCSTRPAFFFFPLFSTLR